MEILKPMGLWREELKQIVARPDMPPHLAKKIGELIPHMRRQRLEPPKPRLRPERPSKSQIAQIKRDYAETHGSQKLDWYARRVGLATNVVSNIIHGSRAARWFAAQKEKGND